MYIDMLEKIQMRTTKRAQLHAGEETKQIGCKKVFIFPEDHQCME